MANELTSPGSLDGDVAFGFPLSFSRKCISNVPVKLLRFSTGYDEEGSEGALKAIKEGDRERPPGNFYSSNN